ncbi:MAG: transcription elongation factor GreA [candidate division WOR-3 bacterium]|nr:transcription elongation factor GreA [candidate division WOR-3 bacterium]
MTEKIKRLIEERNLAEVENLWIEMVEAGDSPVQEFLSIADELKKIKETKSAFMLLEILASHLKIQRRFDEAIEVYKHMAYFTEDDRLLRKAIVELYKTKYNDNPRIERFIELSGIEKGEHIFKSLERLEEFLKYDIGRVFYFEKFGLGEVVSMNPERREVVLDFQKQKGYFAKFEVAQGLLKPAPEGTFLFKKYKNIEELKKLAEEDPVGLVIFMLKSYQEPLGSGDIKKHLTGIIDEGEIDRYWEKVRKKLEKNECVKVESRKGQKIYQYITDGNKKESFIVSFQKGDIDEKYLYAERCAKEYPELLNEIINLLISTANEEYPRHPARCLDIYYLCEEYGKTGISYTIDDILKYETYENLLLNLKNYEHKKKFLQEIKKREPQNWQRIFQQIMALTDETKLIEKIEEELIVSGYSLDEFYKSALSMPQKYPCVFVYILKKLTGGFLKEFLEPRYLPRLINNLEYIKNAKPNFLKALTLERFDSIIKNTEITEVARIREALVKSTVLKGYEKGDYLRIIDYYFPDLNEKKEDYIYTTAEALERKKKELEHLLTVEIPENKKEISRAREYGDLSENFEYKAAKEKQDQLYQKVRMLESELRRAKLIDFSNIDTSRVGVGTKVILKSLQDDSILEYVILGPWDADLAKNIISCESPIARDVLLGKKPGETVSIDGKGYQIVKIETARN